VRVDDATVNLSLIQTYEASCFQAPEDKESALAVKRELIPIGTKVLVVRADLTEKYNGNYSGFVTPLESLALAPDAPFSGSYNERLVASGYWVPDVDFANTWEVGDAKAATYEVDSEYLSEAERGFGPYILASANVARATAVGGQELCVAQLAEQALVDAAHQEACYSSTPTAL
jgi:hypothetical protein